LKGLLLELFRVVAGTLQIDEHKNRIQSEKLHFLKNSSKKNATNENETITRLSLNDSVDGIYVENRYKHFKHFVNLLSLRAKALGMEGRNIQGMEINEMKNFVKKLPKVTSQKKELFKHLILCENIVNEIGSNFELSQTIEESMLYNRNKKQTFQKILELLTTDAHRYNSLRFICLLHLTCGLNADEAATFMTNYLNAFGYQHFPIFGHLGVAKLYPSFNNSAKTKVFNISFPMIQNAFQIEANRMKLLPGNIDGRRDPVDSSFVFNGSYIPFIAQLLNVLCSASKIDDFAEKFGQTEHILFYRFYQQHLELGTKEMMSAIKKGEISDIFPLRSRTIFCFVIGGITCGELAAIHFIERMTGSKIVVASDCISSGTDFVEAAFF
ncbi:uncharacterized protein LOC116347667, partial [Contarinia nasturtii]|uniref:uncharacterized protein LOC116347667 n=1 Tax=Contarinia nasturtii TaxID=265458 RepID=UPI0012D3C913